MRGSEIRKLGVPSVSTTLAQQLCGKASSLGYSQEDMRDEIKRVVSDPESSLDEPAYGGLARYRF